MNAEMPLLMPEKRPRWRRRLSVLARRSRVIPWIEAATLAAMIVMATVSYYMIAKQGSPQALLSPPLVAMLLVANLVPAMALMVFLARRIAMGRAARSAIGGRGRLSQSSPSRAGVEPLYDLRHSKPPPAPQQTTTGVPLRFAASHRKAAPECP